MQAIPRKPLASCPRVSRGPALVRDIYQIGSGYVVLEPSTRLRGGASRWKAPPGHRVLSAICDRIPLPADASDIGRSLGRVFDRLGVVVDMTSGQSMSQWSIADSLIGGGLEVAPRLSSLIATEGLEALQGMVATMADDEVIAFFTADVPRARDWVRALDGLPIDAIEAKPQSVRIPELFGDSAAFEALPLAG